MMHTEPLNLQYALLLDLGCCPRAHVVLIEPVEPVEPEEKKTDKMHQVVSALPSTQNIQGVTVHHPGQPTTNRWYTEAPNDMDGLGGGISNGEFRAAFQVHGPQVYRAQKTSCTIASHLAQRGDKIILGNQGAEIAYGGGIESIITDHRPASTTMHLPQGERRRQAEL